VDEGLCERGNAYARNVVLCVHPNAGKAYSAVDRCATATQQNEIPGFDVIRGLLKAVDQGLQIRSQEQSPVVSYDRTYHAR
jgi:hypothetical protein